MRVTLHRCICDNCKATSEGQKLPASWRDVGIFHSKVVIRKFILCGDCLKKTFNYTGDEKPPAVRRIKRSPTDIVVEWGPDYDFDR